MSERTRADTSIRVPRRAVVLGSIVTMVVLLLAVVFVLGSVVRAAEPTAVANAVQVKSQQTAAERDVERAYEQAIAQVKKVRALNLALPTSQADQVAAKALSDLKTLRHSAFVSLAQITGASVSDGENYATVTEQRLDQAPVAGQAAASPMLLAPRFYTIVARMSELATQLADNATNQLTASPTSSPSPGPTTQPSPTTSPRPSPSPTR